MKVRFDHVTNSSSSSFIIKNKSDSCMSAEDIVMSLFKDILEDAKDRFILSPGEEITIECGDHYDDGAFENFIHREFGCYGDGDVLNDKDVEISFHESHH